MADEKENGAIEGEVVVVDMTSLMAITKAEIDANVATAKQYPRSIALFRKEMLELVTLTQEIAEQCIFALPRGKESGKQKFIEGASVRFSEMMISAYGNCRSGARIIGEEKDFIIAEGFFHDLEKNVAVKCEIKRRITNSRGQRYNTDMIAVTGNAAASIARRNAALQGVPKAIWNEFYEKARATAVGDEKTLLSRRIASMQYFQKMNVSETTIFDFLGVEGLEDIGLDELAILTGIKTAIKEGSTTVDKAFTVEEGERNAGAKKIFESLGKNDKEKTDDAGGPVPAKVAVENSTVKADDVPRCEECFEILPAHHFTCSKSTDLPPAR